MRVCHCPLIIACCVRVRQVRWVQGYRNLPERFPRRFYEGQPPQLVFSSDVGSINSPIPYYHFSCMFRPLLERKYQEGTSIWAKSALVATMWVSEERCVFVFSPSVPTCAVSQARCRCLLPTLE
jgi:hypothetical protein